MVAPGNRRPGHSRRAQYGIFFGYVLATAGMAIGVVLLIVSYSNSGAFSGLRGVATDVASGPARAAAAGRTEGQGLVATLGGFFTRGSRVARLEKEVAEARVLLAEARAQKEENARLKALLGLAQEDPRPVAIARLIGSTSASTRRYATLGAGSADGVRAGMPVRSSQGVVGQVLEAGSSSARILLITDTESSIPVRRAGDGVQAYANGRGDGSLQIKLINTSLNPLRKGDAIVTSGSGGLFRPGMAVAVVTEITRDGAVARPLSDPGMTEFVAVERPWDETRPPAAAVNAAKPGDGA
jgi:rod shape-determining protein MreC